MHFGQRVKDRHHSDIYVIMLNDYVLVMRKEMWIALRLVYNVPKMSFLRLRPYHVENTGSRLITEVKQRRARLVLGWVTAWEYRVP